MDTSIWTVLLYATLTAVATGFGAVPLFFFKRVQRWWIGIGSAVASGLMLAASFNLVFEGIGYGMPRTVAGLLLGLGGIVASRRLLPEDEVRTWGSWPGRTPSRRCSSSAS